MTCLQVEREYEADMTGPRKPSSTQRGYGYAHKQRRKAVAAEIVRTGGVPCARACGQLVRPCDAWELDHDDDRRGYRGPAHKHCNRSAGGKKATGGDPKPRPTTRW